MIIDRSITLAKRNRLIGITTTASSAFLISVQYSKGSLNDKKFFKIHNTNRSHTINSAIVLDVLQSANKYFSNQKTDQYTNSLVISSEAALAIRIQIHESTLNHLLIAV